MLIIGDNYVALQDPAARLRRGRRIWLRRAQHATRASEQKLSVWSTTTQRLCCVSTQAAGRASPRNDSERIAVRDPGLVIGLLAARRWSMPPASGCAHARKRDDELCHFLPDRSCARRARAKPAVPVRSRGRVPPRDRRFGNRLRIADGPGRYGRVGKRSAGRHTRDIGKRAGASTADRARGQRGLGADCGFRERGARSFRSLGRAGRCRWWRRCDGRRNG